MSSDYMTIDEIRAKYPNEWVLIDRPRRDRSKAVSGGYVIDHHPERDEFDRRLEIVSPSVVDCAIRYTGTPDPDEVWLLNL